jgi:hypothetical protein
MSRLKLQNSCFHMPLCRLETPRGVLWFIIVASNARYVVLVSAQFGLLGTNPAAVRLLSEQITCQTACVVHTVSPACLLTACTEQFWATWGGVAVRFGAQGQSTFFLGVALTQFMCSASGLPSCAAVVFLWRLCEQPCVETAAGSYVPFESFPELIFVTLSLARYVVCGRLRGAVPMCCLAVHSMG